MSIDLTRLCFEQTGFTATQKHILSILCFTANKDNEVFLTIDQIMEKSGRCRNKVESILKIFRDKKILIYTGKNTSYRNRIPIYRISFNHPTKEGDKSLITPFPEFNDPILGCLMTPLAGIPIDNIKNNNKDNSENPFSFLTHEERKELEYCQKGNFKLGPDFKHLQPLLDEMMKCDKGMAKI
ncbi:hypothetical protein [Pedobacter sp.]|uniref:hypothetical protein n=1 Tax=Pedobacter sp. TaxID=1411316 RepID=UPI002C1D49DD|nr:hypothetical protein [Pedobacter sp.]HWW39679.1 hypothetical protein [Pedobacter sp.]